MPRQNLKMKSANISLRYGGKDYSFVSGNIDPSIEDHSIEFLWTEGNFSCDCNKSGFIQRQCDKNFPAMECGDEIELVSISIVRDA